MQDAKELASLFERDSNERKLEVFNDRIYTAINDINSTTTMVMFDNQSTMNGLYSVDDAYIEIPIGFATDGTASSPGDLFTNYDILEMALRNSTTDLISGIQLQLSDGQTLLQELDAPSLINPIRKLLDYNDLGLGGRAAEIQYAPDDYPNLAGSCSSGGNIGVNTLSVAGATGRLGWGTNPAVFQGSIPYERPNMGSVNCSAIATTGAGVACTCTVASTAGMYVGMPFYFVCDVNNTGTLASGSITWPIFGTPAFTTAAQTTYYVAAITSSTNINYTNTLALALAGTSSVHCTTALVIGTGCLLQLVPVNQANPVWNKGFAKRIQFRRNFTVATSTTAATINAIIYLKDLHDIFRQWTFPITNVRFQLRLTLAYPMNSNGIVNAIQMSGNTYSTGTTLAVSQTPSATNFFFTPGNARLYMKQITLTPEQNVKLQKRLDQKEGFKKHLVYAETQYTKLATALAVATATTYTITNSITGVKRLIIFGVSNSASYNLLSWTSSPKCVQFSQCQILVNNVPLEKYLLDNERKLFQSLKEQTHNAGESNHSDSLINFQKYCRGADFIYVFDFQRLGVRPNENVPIQLQVTLKTINSPTSDIYALMEREAHIDLMVDTNSARIVKDYL